MAFRFLHPIFSGASPPGKFDKELMLRGIERVVDGTDPRLRAVSHYRRQLWPAVERAIDFVVTFVDALPPAIVADRRGYMTDPRLRALFASPESLREILSFSDGTRAYLKQAPDPLPAELFKRGAVDMQATAWLTLIVLLLFGTVDCAAQTAAPYGGAWTLTWENDIGTGSDNNYTNGIGVSWVSNAIDTHEEHSFVRRWGEFWSFLPFVGDSGYRTYVAWSVAQEMHTPDDITLRNPPMDDEPYAGVLYLDSVIYAKSDRWTHAWQLRVGVVGPSSQAENVQKWVHKVFGADEPMGWDTQLPNEPVLNVGYTGTYLLAQGDLGNSASWRVAPVANAGLGTYFTGAGLGLYGEVGWNLVDAMGGTALRQGFNAASTVGVGPVDRWSVSLSGGFAGYGVVQYLPLDGTVFRDSRSVDSKPFIGMATLGITARRGGFVFFLGQTFFTKTFETERERVQFGTLSLSWYH